ncbi:hypothetical protein MATR_23540 [Marivirga tractuosa]|uniref:Uncharacterized protein n=1 Tax=Marivirga tractuosa (strain ATCC 23168 / DSM 4126 / NBRC 15989 / NCIMB 1408 / VKM B-1430 / H-43) TaxID=643867 RepID=E4TUR1_MARTH|nr:DUF6728 family protein [Marivirga tractuosa]ADR20039.1 hypothetical protein Ftrac_0022 [Marivirga tractuosa DSM 4126]BDD15529.1 hypothetical protein MATR_23540 [Marivirga tractuosa]
MSKEFNSNQENKTSDHWSAYFRLGAVLGYFKRLFGKKDPNAPSNFNLKMMHGINKISIVMFLIAVIVMVTRAILRS